VLSRIGVGDHTYRFPQPRGGELRQEIRIRIRCQGVHIGLRMQALAVYLVVFQNVPVERCRNLVAT
jgi:hypothetical protein